MSDEKRMEMLLKSGKTADLHFAIVEWHRLSNMQAKRPKIFDALVKLAKDPSADIDRAMLMSLDNYGELARDKKSVHPLVKEVLLSSLVETAEGQVLANPFVLRTDEDKTLVERMENMINAHSDKFLRDLRDGPGPQRFC